MGDSDAAVEAGPAAFAAGLTEFFGRHAVPTHHIVSSEPYCYTVWVEGDDSAQVRRVVTLLPFIPQIIAYRYDPTSRLALELFALGAEPEPTRDVHYIHRYNDIRELVDLREPSPSNQI